MRPHVFMFQISIAPRGTQYFYFPFLFLLIVNKYDQTQYHITLVWRDSARFVGLVLQTLTSTSYLHKACDEILFSNIPAFSLFQFKQRVSFSGEYLRQNLFALTKNRGKGKSYSMLHYFVAFHIDISLNKCSLFHLNMPGEEMCRHFIQQMNIPFF